jgi:hypothetical protein
MRADFLQPPSQSGYQFYIDGGALAAGPVFAGAYGKPLRIYTALLQFPFDHST